MSSAATAARSRTRAPPVVPGPPGRLSAWRNVVLSNPKLFGTLNTLSRVWFGVKPVGTQESKCWDCFQ